jgi:hypothetical protein
MLKLNRFTTRGFTYFDPTFVLSSTPVLYHEFKLAGSVDCYILLLEYNIIH